MKGNKLSKKQLVLYTSMTIVTVALVVIPIANALIINRMKNETILVGAIVNSEMLQEERKKINDRQVQIQELQDYLETLETINSEIIKIDIINDMFLKTITDRVPEDIFFQNINISAASIQITGVAKNNVSIAQLEQNLRELPYFENVFIPNITANTGGYTFTISFQIKGGLDDETN